MDFSKVKWTKVNLQYNELKNQFQMVYSAKAIPLIRKNRKTRRSADLYRNGKSKRRYS